MKKDKRKNLLSVLSGQEADGIPIWLMRQAGRYLPEYRELRTKAGSFMQLCFTPEMAAEVTIQPIRRFGMDGAILFSDILVVPHGLGLALKFVEGEGPQLERVGDNLPVFDADRFFKITAPIYETLKITKKEIPDHVTLIGFAGSPWTVACYMLGGKGADEFVTARLRAYKDREFFKKLLAVIVEATSFYLIEQVKAGAEVLQLFDSWSGLVPASLYEEWVVHPTAAIVKNVRAVYPTIPLIGFPRMSGGKIPHYVKGTNVNAVSLDQSVDVKNLHSALDAKIILQGNLDPLLMQAEKDVLLDEAEKTIHAMPRPFIFNLGHGLTPQVPPDNVGALVEFVQGYKK